MLSEKLILFTQKVIERLYGRDGWCISGGSLLNVIKHDLVDNDIEISCFGGIKKVLNSLSEYGIFDINNNCVSHGKTKIRLIEDRRCNVLREFASNYKRNRLNFPEEIGGVLDRYDANWIDAKSSRKYGDDNAFFTTKRKMEAHEEIKLMLACAENVGIRDKMFLGFGGLLGYALCNDFLPKDDDIDICFLPITQTQKVQYLNECKNVGLCAHRMKGLESINNEWEWFSIGRKNPYNGTGVKACNWFWFEHGGYWWHSKGNKWTLDKSHSDYPTSKGIPSNIFTGELREGVFGGNKINVPVNVGKCLDWWYPKWIYREQKSSRPTALLVHKDEKNKNTWFIKRGA